MSKFTLKHIILLAYLWLECSIFAASTIVFSYPRADTTWIPGETYDIKLGDDHKDMTVRTWQVDLMVLGAECDGICLHDGVVAEISKDYNTQTVLQFKVPTNLVQHGKGFQVQFSNAGSAPIYHSEIFSIEKAATRQPDKERNLSSEDDTRTSENSAPFVLPAVLVTTLVLGFSCVFAFLMI
ncbi:hypothetical protein BGX27_009032 [Mortierella sp. AM989]|nr:hypothetical protein BGX27_009032 [Mortierella sp. AM989]